MYRNILLFVLVLCLFACNPKTEQANTDVLYFDLAGYFKNESARLKILNPTVIKMVSVDGNTEKQSLKISDWEKELAIFANADINKASWRGSFKMSKENNRSIYKSNDKKIPVKEVTIESLNNHIQGIKIIISNVNALYSSHDTLIYLPNHSYQIKKQQNIKLLNAKRYQITGKFEL